MKKIIFILIIFIFNIFLVNADSTIFFDNNLLKLSLMNQNPDPVSPGEEFDLRIRVQAVSTNARDNDFQDLKVTLIEDERFSASNPIRHLGNLKESEVVDVVYRVKLSDDAPDGINRLKFKYSSSTRTEVESNDYLSINVRSVEHVLAVTSIETQPENIIPGSKTDLSLTIKNAATSSMRDLAIKLNLENTVFTPVGTTSEKRIRLLQPGDEAFVLFGIIADADAESKPYKIPLSISYLDDQGNKFTKNDTIGLLVYSQPELKFSIEDYDVVQKGQNGEVIVSVSNVGVSEVKFISVELIGDETYNVIGVDKSYLGNLDPDDFQTASFNIHIADKYPKLRLKVDYKDSYNKDFNKEVVLPLEIYSKSNASKYGLAKSNRGIFTWIIYVLLAIFIYHFIVGWKKEKALGMGISYGLKRTLRAVFRFFGFFRPRNLKKIPDKIKKLMKE